MRKERLGRPLRMARAALFPNRQQVLIMQDADNLFGRALVYRQARMLLLDHGVEHVVERGIARNAKRCRCAAP